MLKNALNRCQATPMFRIRLMTTSQVRLTTILTNATTVSRSGLSGRMVATRPETGCDQPGASVRSLETLSARISRMQTPTVATTNSTK